MKKKGLIISTVVMVVVLITALTTATYAWFTAADSVKVDSISLSVKSSAKVNVGVKVDSTKTDSTAYRYNEMIANGNDNTVSWENNENIGLSSLLTFNNLVLGRDKAIGSSTASENWGTTAGKTAFDTTTLVLGTTAAPKYIVKAKGAGTEVDYDTAEIAVANIDYLDATIGIEANDARVTGTYVKVTVTTTDSNPTLGINAAVHFIIVVNGKYIDLQPFGTASNTTLKSSNSLNNSSVPTGDQGYCKPAANNQVSSTFYFWVAKGAYNETDKTYGVLKTGGEQISDFRILAYIDGADEHCVKDATGGCTIDIEFDGSVDSKCEVLGDEATQTNTVKWINPNTNVPA